MKHLRADWNRLITTALPWAIALGSFAALLVFVVRYGITVPYWDQWELVPTLVKMHDGTLSWGDLVAQHNAHRILFPRFIMLGLASATDWNNAYELAVNVILGVAIFALLAAFGSEVARKTPGLTAAWAWTLAALCAFTLAQWRNWLWGWQLQIFLCVACGLAALTLVWHVDQHKAAILAAVAVAGVATYSFAAGLAVWPAGVAVLIWSRPSRLYAALSFWCFAALLFAYAYLQNFELPGDAHPPSVSLSGVFIVFAYVFAFLGSAVANPAPWLSVIAGFVGAGIIMRCGAVVWHNPERRRQFAMIKGVAAFVFGCAIIAAMGRGGEGIDQAVASRYTTFSAPFWFMVALSALLLARGPGGVPRRRWHGVAAVIALALIVNSAVGLWEGSQRGNAMNAAREALVHGDDAALLDRLYPDRSILLERRASLRALGLSVFHRD